MSRLSVLYKTGFVVILVIAVISPALPQSSPEKQDADYQIEVENNTICSFINSNNVSVRQNPNLKSPVITKLNRGDSVRATGRTGNWVHIAARDSRSPPTPYTPLNGYVFNQYINGCSEDQFERWRK